MENINFRIGNYVNRGYFNEDPKTGRRKEFQNCEIVSLGLENLLTTESLTRRKYIKTYYENLKGIEISEFYLINLSFKKLDKYTYVINGFFIHRRKRGYVFGGKNGVILSYIHQLQNLYFDLKGTELKSVGKKK